MVWKIPQSYCKDRNAHMYINIELLYIFSMRSSIVNDFKLVACSLGRAGFDKN